MSKELINYINDPNEVNTFNLAVWYENQNHLSPACSFYLRCSEITKNKDLIYECLLRMYICYKNLSNRNYTCENLLKNALLVNPKNPEAYFLLSQFYENNKNWVDSYLYASLGLELTEGNPSKLVTSVGYDHKYMLIFQKAVSSWWFGKPKESRNLFQILKNEYIENLNNFYYKLVENNITNLGSGSESESGVRYNSSKHDKLKFKFKNSNKIEMNFSQTYQDMFVLFALDGKTNGSYLEIGAAHPFHNSNTALLEKLGWKGIGIEYKKELADQHVEQRKNKVLNTDALGINYEKLLLENFSSNIIDYLQLDIEPARNTFEALLMIPFDQYQFRVITYEHDFYVDMTQSYREKSRRYLRALGYTLVFGNISPNENCPFEDWWIKKDLIDSNIIEKLLNVPQKDINQIEKLILN
jgi:hypothetical protein